MLDFPYNSAHILECEYYVLEELNFQLIIYHPYRPLIQYVPRATFPFSSIRSLRVYDEYHMPPYENIYEYSLPILIL